MFENLWAYSSSFKALEREKLERGGYITYYSYIGMCM